MHVDGLVEFNVDKMMLLILRLQAISGMWARLGAATSDVFALSISDLPCYCLMKQLNQFQG